MDIQSLNKLLMPNTYTLPGQSKIIAILQECIYIIVLHIVFFLLIKHLLQLLPYAYNNNISWLREFQYTSNRLHKFGGLYTIKH